MKNKSNRRLLAISILSFGIIILLGLENGIAQNRNTTSVEIKVLGNCGMCKERIEKAAYSVTGVRSAGWDNKTQMLSLVYRNDRTSQETIERAIARAGHDTENFLTDEQTYANMRYCCKYERNPEWLKRNKLHNKTE